MRTRIFPSITNNAKLKQQVMIQQDTIQADQDIQNPWSILTCCQRFSARKRNLLYRSDLLGNHNIMWYTPDTYNQLNYCYCKVASCSVSCSNTWEVFEQQADSCVVTAWMRSSSVLRLALCGHMMTTCYYISMATCSDFCRWQGIAICIQYTAQAQQSSTNMAQHSLSQMEMLKHFQLPRVVKNEMEQGNYSLLMWPITGRDSSSAL